MYIADLHIHSRYSRATSRDGCPEQLDLWARRKGITLVGTGDFTHPAWREELKEKLEPAKDGLYVLKEEYRIRDGMADDSFRPRFVVTGEISSIYKKNGKVRKIHSLLLLPGLEEADVLSEKLAAIGNIHSDGRPILGLDCRDLLEIQLTVCPEGIYVPAHIWTPHFALFGAFSGFDAIEECFEDLTPHIHALETGLSSDPPMNWRVSALDRYQLLSNSDAHSPAKLGREANLLNGTPSYEGLKKAVETGEGLQGTIEFFPEEGKYHYDGHRKCHLCLKPSEAEQYGGRCPVCGKKLTIGVSHRVEQLSDREEGAMRPGAKDFERLVPLPEVIAAAAGSSASSKKVQEQYGKLLGKLGNEFSILREIPVEDIRKAAGGNVAEGIRRLRCGEVRWSPGFDGEYGRMELFAPGENENVDGQISLFGVMAGDAAAGIAADGHGGNTVAAGSVVRQGRAAADEESPDVRARFAVQTSTSGRILNSAADTTVSDSPVGMADAAAASGQAAGSCLNPEQTVAVRTAARAIAVIAGPGTGKTSTLVSRIRYLISERHVKPSEITAVTFTRKAARELQERLVQEMGGKRAVSGLKVGTFHGLCYDLLKKEGREFRLADELQMTEMADEIIGQYSVGMKAKEFLQQISLAKTAWSGSQFAESARSGGQFAESARSGSQFAESARSGSQFAESAQSGSQFAESAQSGSQFAKAVWSSSRFAEAAEEYARRMKADDLLDFDDLLLTALDRAEADPKGGRSFHYLLVDEFQDVSPLEYRLLKAWNKKGRELFVIGDPDQSIYGFRGSDAACFARLEEDFPELVRIRLVENYRSTPQIIESALAVIEKNPGEPRQLKTFRKPGLPLRIATAPTEMSEAIFAAKEINRLVGGIDMLDTELHGPAREERRVRSFSEIAVLYRNHCQAEALEKCLAREGIPYVVVGREDFLNAPSVRGTVAFFRYLSDSQAGEEVQPAPQSCSVDEAAQRSSMPQSGSAAEAAQRSSMPQSGSADEAAQRSSMPQSGSADEAALRSSVPQPCGADEAVQRSSAPHPDGRASRSACPGAAGADGLRQAAKLLWQLPEGKMKDAVLENMCEKYRPKLSGTRPRKLLTEWFEDCGLSKDKDAEKLLSMAVFYRTMPEMLEALAFGGEGDLRRCGGRSYTADAVTLMTLHASKGLEYPVVFLCGVRKGVLPMESTKHEADEEEERRLFFVGMTRAREELILTTSGEPSRFLSELPAAGTIREKTGREKTKEQQLSLFDFMN